ncbi:MAG: dinitrogenase iron-molybdenum cofactor biosynthesis protein [Thermoplasmatales archaeon]|jgi:predicted Fe-Mo cluster-binding NifX family protein|nr:dinitrogenase iron-molybdenum cofactor biosynthesis protein [Thermoplasmatales archaeon]
MKIIMPVNSKAEDPDIAQSLSRAPYFMIYDTDAKASDFISNPAMDSPSGAGVKAAQIIIDTGAKVLLTIRCGDRAYEVLNGGNIKIMAAAPGKAKTNIDTYLGGGMNELETIHEGHHGGAN